MGAKQFTPENISPACNKVLQQNEGAEWTPLFRHSCTFPPEIFRSVMLNLIRNPNINSNHLVRADVLLDVPFSEAFRNGAENLARIIQFKDFDLTTVMVRTLIPRNPVVDRPLDQTCLIYEKIKDDGEIQSLVIYLPHMSSAAQSPFYHPAVYGIGFLHTWRGTSTQDACLDLSEANTVSIHYSFFESEPRSLKLERTAYHLLAALCKHGQGMAAGYVKRVQHDVLIPQASVQNTYARLKAKYARPLIEAWVESTDPGKHVFEDLGIAAFLIELWSDMYKNKNFPGFVDIGCGNGLLVHILLQEGYSGWGFDARKRKSWSTYGRNTFENLKEKVLIPSLIQSFPCAQNSSEPTPSAPSANNITDKNQEIGIHDGVFPKETFIISNHADELTAWTPVLANISESPFLMIPCCSHAFNGTRFRAPPPKNASASCSAYASLVAWVSKIAIDCGWDVEKENLRIPSTRNLALLGRHRLFPFESSDNQKLVAENGGAEGWQRNALKLSKGATRGH